MTTRPALLLFACLACRAEIIDRIAVRVGTSVITESQIRRDIRLTALLDGDPLVIDSQTKRESAERLVDQRLVRSEMEVSRYPAPGKEVLEGTYTELLSNRFGKDPAKYREALQKYGLTDEDVREHLLWQLTLVRFIGVRFRTGVQIQEKDIDEYFQKELLPKLQMISNGEPPVAEEYRTRIEEKLIEERVNEHSEEWLKKARTSTPIEFRPEAFK